MRERTPYRPNYLGADVNIYQPAPVVQTSFSWLPMLALGGVAWWLWKRGAF